MFKRSFQRFLVRQTKSKCKIYFIGAEDVANLHTMMILGEVGRMEVVVARMVGVVEKMVGGAKKRWAEGRERSEK